MITLGFETSCDETSVAVVSGKSVLSNVVYSQISEHALFGGIVPEIASRNHILKIALLTKEALSKANTRLQDINLISVTSEPGLIGALLVGVSFAKSLAYSNSIPFVGVNHLKAHLYSAFLEGDVPFPFIGLTVSGGHTNLTLVKDFLEEKIIGNTYDDAAGEAFDKIASLLKLGYPGGPKLEEFAKNGNENAINFPRPLLNSKNKEDYLNFSFSGLKSSVVNYMNNNPNCSKADVASSFQKAATDVLCEKLYRCSKKYNVKNIVVAGGVACNKSLRNKIFEKFNKKEYKIFVPSNKYCTDNAAMIAYLGEKYFEKGIVSPLTLGASSRS